MNPSTIRLIAYAAVVFAASALVLVLEIVAARLIAPFVGVSLYSWTAIIGVILAGLSLGNWLGGAWADRGGAERAAGWTLFAAGLSAFAVLLILPRLAEPLQTAELSLAGTSLTLAAALFFVPAVLLGVITPLLTTLALRDSTRPGHVIGLMHALAALGSILGTFATGFWLVQWVGSRDIVLATGVVLILLGLPLLRRGRDIGAGGNQLLKGGRGAGRAHIVRATLESIAYQTRDVIDVMNADSGVPLRELRVDGGAAANDFLMQFQADILGVPVDRPALVETTAAGSAFLAGLATGFWSSPDELRDARRRERLFEPSMDAARRDELLRGWKRAVGQARAGTA